MSTDASHRRLRVCTVVGARPQFVKAFPLSRAFAASADFEEVMIHTGQHFDSNMSDVFFAELGIRPPKYHFAIHGGTHAQMTGRMLEAVEQALAIEKPDAVLVFGDTDSTLAGALAAAKLYIPLVHAEAGLRSFNRLMPEEINRVVADHVSSVLLCPTRTAVENLALEGIARGVHCVGDLMYDATLLGVELAKRHSSILRDLQLSPKRYGVATVHRAHNTDDRAYLSRVMDFLAHEARRLPIVVPLHPRTRKAAQAAGLDWEVAGIRVIDPVGYLDMCQLLQNATLVLTDSGGIQKEAYFHRVPCVTLRAETEWVETIDAGWNRLWTEAVYRPRREISDYGDGNAAASILAVLQREIVGTTA